MGVVVDTSVFIGAEHGAVDLGALLEPDERYYIAAVTVSELLTGVAMAKTPAVRVHRLTWAESLIQAVPLLPFDLDVARTYAEVWSQGLKAGGRAGSNAHDLQIAATAITHGFAVMTANVKDFEKVPGVRVVSM
ncbi:MAG: PIN domain-containing protein [Gammaproteobacteria bacterium]